MEPLNGTKIGTNNGTKIGTNSDGNGIKIGTNNGIKIGTISDGNGIKIDTNNTGNGIKIGTNNPQQTPMNTEIEAALRNNNKENNNKEIYIKKESKKENKEKISTLDNLKERQLEKLEEQKENTHLREKDKKEEQLREQTIKEMIQKIIVGYNKEFAEPLGKQPIEGTISMGTYYKVGKLLQMHYTVEDFIKAFQRARESSFLKNRVNFTLSWLVKTDDRLGEILEGKFDDLTTKHNYDNSLNSIEDLFKYFEQLNKEQQEEKTENANS